MKIVLIISAFGLLTFCKQRNKIDSSYFKKGVFEIPAKPGYSKMLITRKDSIQIEEYEKNINFSIDDEVVVKKIKQIDTLYIKWKNNFYYTLKMKSPKNELEKKPVFVRITKIMGNSYNFTAKIGYSKFSTDGTIYKIK